MVESLYSTKTSKVFHVVHQESKIELALKCYSKSNMIDLQKIQAVREIWFHSHLTHPNIISMFAAWIEKGKICLAIEYAPIGSAFRKLRKLGSFPEAVSAKYIIFKNLCALQFLHEIGLIHRDIKPEVWSICAVQCHKPPASLRMPQLRRRVTEWRAAGAEHPAHSRWVQAGRPGTCDQSPRGGGQHVPWHL